MPKGPSKIKNLESSDILLINKYTGDVFQSDVRISSSGEAEMSVHNEKGEKVWVEFNTDDYSKIDLKEEYKNLALGDYVKHGQSQELLEGIVKQVYDVDLREVYGYEKYNDDSFKNIKADYLNLQAELKEINSEVQSEFSKKNDKGDAEYVKLYATKLYEAISRPRVCDIARDIYVYKAVTEGGLTTAEAVKQYNIEKEGNEIVEIKARAQSELEVAKSNFEGASVEISSYKHYGANDMRTVVGSLLLPFIMRVAGKGLGLLGVADYETFKKRYPIGATLGQYKFIKNNIDHYKFARDEYISKSLELARINDISSDVEKKYRHDLNDIKNELKDLTNESKDLINDIEKASDEKKEILNEMQTEKDKGKLNDLQDKLDKVNDKISDLEAKKKDIDGREEKVKDKYSKTEERMKIEFRNKSEKDHELKQELRKDFADKKDKLDAARKELSDLEQKPNKNEKKIEVAKSKVEKAEKKFNESKDKLEKARIKEPSEVELEMLRGAEKKNDDSAERSIENKEDSVENSNEKVDVDNQPENKDDSNYENKDNTEKDTHSSESKPETNNEDVNKDLLDAINKKNEEKDALSKKVDALEKKVDRQVERLGEAKKKVENATDPQEKAKAERLVENISNDLYGEKGLINECTSAKNELDSLNNELKIELDTLGAKFEKPLEKNESSTEQGTEKPIHKRDFSTDFIDAFMKRYEPFLNEKTKETLSDLKVEFNKLNDTLNEIDAKFENVPKDIELKIENPNDENPEIQEDNSETELPIIEDMSEYEPNEIEEIHEEDLIPIEEINADDLEPPINVEDEVPTDEYIEITDNQENEETAGADSKDENVENAKQDTDVAESKRIDSIMRNPEYTDRERAIWIMSGEQKFEDVKLHEFDKMMNENPENFEKFEDIYRKVVDFDNNNPDRAEMVKELTGESDVKDSNVELNQSGEATNDNIDNAVRDEMDKYTRNYKDLPIDFSQVKNSRDLKTVCRFGDFFLNLEKQNPHAGLSEIDTHKVSLVEKREEDFTEYNFFRNENDKCNLIGVSGSEYVFEFSKSIIDNKISAKNYEGNICDFIGRRLDVSDMKLTSVYELDGNGNRERLDFSKMDDTEKNNVIFALAAMIENDDKADEVFDKSELLDSDDLADKSEEDAPIENEKDVTEQDDETFEDTLETTDDIAEYPDNFESPQDEQPNEFENPQDEYPDDSSESDEE